jgi:hypothetical protein
MFRRVILIGALIACAGTETAQVTPGDARMTLGGGVSWGTPKIGEEKVMEGPSVFFSYEDLEWGRPVGFLFSVGYGVLDDKVDETADVISRSITTIPIYFGVRTWIGQGALQGNLGAVLGAHINTLETTVQSDPQSQPSSTKFRDSGWGLGVPVGLALSLSPNMHVGGYFTLNWLWNNDLFKDDLYYTATLGIGFKIG